MTCHFTSIRMDFHKKFKNAKYQVLVRMGKIGTFVRCWWEFLNKNPATMENRMQVLKKLNTEVSHKPAIPLLDIYQKELKAGA